MQLSKTGKVTCDRDDMTTVTATTKVIISNVEQQYISISATAAAGRRGDGGGGGIHSFALAVLSMALASSSRISLSRRTFFIDSIRFHRGHWICQRDRAHRWIVVGAQQVEDFRCLRTQNFRRHICWRRHDNNFRAQLLFTALLCFVAEYKFVRAKVLRDTI